jgi:hypothetical protein
MSLKAERNKKKIITKARKGFRGFPLATIAHYGPTNKKATKVVVCIRSSEDAEPGAMKKWFSDSDARNDEVIANEISAFLSAHDIKSVIMPDRIIGCPHEEGIDYPDGEVCQECTFWKGRDRWTGERIH